MSLSTSGRTWEEASSPAAVRLARRYESAWREAPTLCRRPDLSAYLSEAAGCPGGRLALLRAEMSLRWEAGERFGADGCRARFTDLAGEELVALIYEEFCLREEGAEAPDPSDYVARYPEVASALRRVFDIHGLVGSGTTTATLSGANAPALPFPKAGETIAGFRLMEELGRGAFARVFLAQERQLGDRPVALKVARAGSREPQTLARLQHTHIVPVYSYRTDKVTGLHLLCMPFFGRVTLARVLADPKVRVARSGADLVASLDRLGASDPAPTAHLTARAALARRTYAQAIAWWGARMAEALEHAHDRGVLHRDVKPSNVLVTADGMPMLLDFNLARNAVPDELDAEQTVPGGTLDYMAPEHLEELAEGLSDRVDARSDVYGLGVLLYEALMGARPFRAPQGAASAAEMLLRAAEERRAGSPRLRTRRPEVPAALEAVVRRCLEPEPDDRYGTAAELAADLQAVADDRPLRFASEPWPDRAGRWVRRHRRVLATALPVLLALSGVVALVVKEQTDRNRLWAKARRLYDDGVASESAGNPARAMVQFESAARLVELPVGDEPAPRSRSNPAVESPSAVWASLEELRQQARQRYKIAVQTADYRAAAAAVTRAADPLRFRLIGFGGDLIAASKSLDELLRPFHVFEPDNWLHRADMTRLDDEGKAKLAREVNELLFLLAVALDRDGDPLALRRGLDVCDLALGFVTPGGPWRALRARLACRLAGGEAPPSSERAELADETSALACFQWGALRLREDRRLDSIVWFKKAVRLEEGNYWFQFYLAYAHNGPPGGSAEPLRYYDAAVALAPRSPWVRFCRARLYREGKAWGLAMEEFQRALADFQALPEADRDRAFESQARLELGLVRQSLGDLAGARAEYDAVIAIEPAGAYARAARFNRAKLDADAGAVADARTAYDALLASNPDDATARLGRALLALRVGDPARADTELTTLLGRTLDTTDRAEALAHRALARLSLGQASRAAADADEAFRLRPALRHERLWIRALLALERVDDVPIGRPEDLFALPLNGPPLRNDLLRLAERSERAAAVAESKGDEVAALHARLTRAVVLSAVSDPLAEPEADRAVALAPLSSRAFLTRARVRRQAGRLPAARQDVERALTLAADDPQVWELRGDLRALMGEPTGGLADLDRAIALGGEGAVRSVRAGVLLAMGDSQGAVRDWTTALAHDPDDPRAYLGRAEAYMAHRQWDQALADLEQAAGWSDGRPGLTLQIARAYARCLPQRPHQFSRFLSLARRAWSAPRQSLAREDR
jgi:eukaryotic-like serine/threonine-protein kinase